MIENKSLIDKYKLQVLIIERPYDTFVTSELTKNLMAEIFKLKFEGYCSKYPYGIMPVSDYDFMATHVCLVMQDGAKLLPISAFKSISSDACKAFNVPFPIINHMFGIHKANYPLYVEALQNWENNLESKAEIYAYNASWTMRTDLPKDLRDLVREISYALFYHHYTSSRIQNVINATSANFNVNKHQEIMGLKYLKTLDGTGLEAYRSPAFFNEPFYFMYTDGQGYSEIYARKCRAYERLWKNRMVINKENQEMIKKVGQGL